MPRKFKDVLKGVKGSVRDSAAARAIATIDRMLTVDNDLDGG